MKTCFLPFNRIAIAIALLATTAGGAFGNSKLIDNLQAGKSQKVVFYGTSLTAGGGWVTHLESWLDASYPGKLTYVNSGLSGKASRTGLSGIASNVTSKNPDTVFIEFEMNDAFNAYTSGVDFDYNISLQESKDNLNAMINAIQTAKPSAEIILQTMNPAFDSTANTNMSGTKRPNLASYYQGYRDVAATRGLVLVDNYPNWLSLQSSNPTLFKSYVADGLHPSDTGYAAVVDPVIQAALVPEPTTFGLLALPLLMLRRRRRVKS